MRWNATQIKKKNNVDKSERNQTPRLSIPIYVKFLNRQKQPKQSLGQDAGPERRPEIMWLLEIVAGIDGNTSICVFLNSSHCTFKMGPFV